MVERQASQIGGMEDPGSGPVFEKNKPPRKLPEIQNQFFSNDIAEEEHLVPINDSDIPSALLLVILMLRICLSYDIFDT